MKKLILCLLIAVFTVPIDAQLKSQLNQEQLNLYLVKAKKMKNVGFALTIIGSVTTVGGSVMASNGLFRHYPSTPGHITNDTYSTVGGVIGLGLVIVGVPLLCIGIPTLTIGIIKYHTAQKNLQISLINIKSPSSYTSINGIGLKIRF